MLETAQNVRVADRVIRRTGHYFHPEGSENRVDVDRHYWIHGGIIENHHLKGWYEPAGDHGAKLLYAPWAQSFGDLFPEWRWESTEDNGGGRALEGYVYCSGLRPQGAPQWRIREVPAEGRVRRMNHFMGLYVKPSDRLRAEVTGSITSSGFSVEFIQWPGGEILAVAKATRIIASWWLNVFEDESALCGLELTNPKKGS